MRSARALTTKKLRYSLAGLSVLTELSIHCGGIYNEAEGVQGEKATEEVKAERLIMSVCEYSACDGSNRVTTVT